MKEIRKNIKKFARNKKGIEVWISWVLLIGFVVVLSSLMYDFIKDYAEETAEDIKRISTNAEECKLVAISIDEVCKQNTTSPMYLNVTVTNRLNINIDELMFRIFDSSNKFLNISRLNVTTSNITLRPQQSKKVTIDISDASADTIHLIPMLHNEELDLTIICSERAAEYENIGEC